ncbi:hypothetical protein Dimus_006862 [Dionaea muscipula]
MYMFDRKVLLIYPTILGVLASESNLQFLWTVGGKVQVLFFSHWRFKYRGTVTGTTGRNRVCLHANGNMVVVSGILGFYLHE